MAKSNTPTVVLVTGPAGSGKTTFCGVLVKALAADTDVLRMAFADSLKEAVVSVEESFKLDWTDWKNYEAKAAARPLLVALASHLRGKDENVFAEYLWSSASHPTLNPTVLVIEDWRYMNEYRFLAERTTVIPIRMSKGKEPANDEEASSLAVINDVFLSLPGAMEIPEWRDETELSRTATAAAVYIKGSLKR